MTDEPKAAPQDAPDMIWAVYPLDGVRKDGVLYGHQAEYFDISVEVDDGFDDPCGIAQYIPKAVSDAALAKARDDALEEAQNACEARAGLLDGFDDEGHCCQSTANLCAADIEALKGKTDE